MMKIVRYPSQIRGHIGRLRLNPVGSLVQGDHSGTERSWSSWSVLIGQTTQQGEAIPRDAVP